MILFNSPAHTNHVTMCNPVWSAFAAECGGTIHSTFWYWDLIANLLQEYCTDKQPYHAYNGGTICCQNAGHFDISWRIMWMAVNDYDPITLISKFHIHPQNYSKIIFLVNLSQSHIVSLQRVTNLSQNIYWLWNYDPECTKINSWWL